jgi:hypothetical protein
MAGEVKQLIEVEQKKKKHKDSTSQFRSNMRERRIRKKIYEKLLMQLTVLVTILVGLAVLYAYFIDT